MLENTDVQPVDTHRATLTFFTTGAIIELS